MKKQKHIQEDGNSSIRTKKQKVRLPDLGICVRCKKNKATMRYTDNALSWSHGFIENICQECYDKQTKNSEWYKQGRFDTLKEVEEKIKEIFYMAKHEFPLVNVDKVLELENWLKQMKS